MLEPTQELSTPARDAIHTQKLQEATLRPQEWTLHELLILVALQQRDAAATLLSMLLFGW